MIFRNYYKIFLLLIVLSLGRDLNAQINYQDTASLIIKPPVVYWFFTGVTFRTNTRTRDIMYYVRPSGTRIFSGDEIEYTRNLWNEGRRKRLTIGPFWDENQANLALNIYQVYTRTTNLKIPYNPSRVVYWFYIRLEERRAGFRWRTTEAGVSSGNIDEFRLSVKNGAQVGLLGIGPFFQYVEVQSAFEIFNK